MCFSVQKHAFLSIKAMLLSSKSIEFINREKQQKMQHAGYQHVAFLLIFALFPAKNFFVENNAKEMLNRNVKTGGRGEVGSASQVRYLTTNLRP